MRGSGEVWSAAFGGNDKGGGQFGGGKKFGKRPIIEKSFFLLVTI